MSYSRRYHEVVSGSKTVRVSYPASENGGSTSVTVDIDIPVNIEIEVDTRPFDVSVHQCSGTVNVLTGAVVAAGTAHVAAIEYGANQVAHSVTQGFDTLIGSEIAQQITEMRTRTEALALKLRDLMQACVAKKEQMKRDYHRISDRYVALFNDLDSELAHRIRTIDEQAFVVCESSAGVVDSIRVAANAMVPAVAAAEVGRGRVALLATVLRNRVMEFLNSSRELLTGERTLAQALARTLTSPAPNSTQSDCVPVAYIAADGLSAGGLERTIAPEGPTAGILQERAAVYFRSIQQWRPMDPATHAKIETLLSNEVAKATTAGDASSARVGAYILQFWRTERPATLGAN